MNHEEHDKAAEEKIKADVTKYGWHVGLFEADDGNPSFAYTIGLWKTYKHPEIICFGLSTDILSKVLNDAGNIVKGGEVIELEKDNHDIFEGVPAQFISVDQNRIADFFGYGMWFYDYQDFPAIQMIWPDKNGKLPWDADFDNAIKDKQIILNTAH